MVDESNNKVIQDAKKRYAEAEARGDTVEMARSHADAEAERAKSGYSGGADGSQYIALNNGSWISDSTGDRETSTNYGSYADDIKKLSELQKKAQAQQLKQAKEQALANLDVQEQKIKPYYYNQKNNASATSQQSARNFAEYLANRGLTNSGASAQAEINRGSALQNTLGNLGIAEANAYRDIANQRTAIENDYVNSLASANSAIEANYFNNLLNYNQQQREKIEALQQSALQQYGSDYQARINELLAQGYDKNSYEVLQLQALRGQKIAQQQSAIANNALAYLQMGYSDYAVANALGISQQDVESIAQYYKELNNLNLQSSQLGVEGQILNNQAMQDQNKYNTWLYNQNMSKPIVSSTGSGRKTSGSSKGKNITQTIVNKIASYDTSTAEGRQKARTYIKSLEDVGYDSNQLQALLDNYNLNETARNQESINNLKDGVNKIINMFK